MSAYKVVHNPWSVVMEAVTKLLSKALTLPQENVRESLEIPPDSKLGDIASTVAFILAKKMKKNPASIASELVDGIRKLAKAEFLIDNVTSEGPYINLFLDRSKFANFVINAVNSLGKNYGRTQEYKGKRALIESPAVNPSKPWHIGHTRNAVIGDTLGNTLEAAGYDVVRLDYINNLGLQIAQIVWKIQQIDDEPNTKYDHYLGHLYVGIQEAFENDEHVEKEIRQVSRDLENLSSKASKVSEEMVTKCVKAQCQTAYRLGIYHDYQLWESSIAHSGFLDHAKAMMLKCEHIVKLEKGPKAGCIVAKLNALEEFKDMKDSDKVLFRSDGTRTYTGADVAFQLWKFGIVKDPFLYEIFERQPNGEDVFKTSTYGFKDGIGKIDIVLNVIASEQAHPQKLVYTILDLLGYEEQSQNSHHIAYEFVGLEDEDFSGRKGTWIGYSCDDVLDKAKELAYKEVVKRNPDMNEEFKEMVAEQVGVGAVRYMLLKASPDRKITFRWDEALNFSGDAAPYLQYSHARAQRLLEKAENIDLSKVNLNLLVADEESELIKAIAKFPNEIQEVVKGLKKSVWGTSFQTNRITSYCYNLANLFSKFYDTQPVLKSNPNVKAARLGLVQAFKVTIANCLEILGIPVVERM